MGKTFRNRVPFGDLRGNRDKKRSAGSRANCAWVSVETRSNRRQVNTALTTHNWDRAMDVGRTTPQAGAYR